MNYDKSRHVPPRANVLIEALRGLGYSTATALADIVDNSIAAGASNVDISFTWNGPQSTVTILDNGSGMTGNALQDAMRLGNRSPLDERAPGDLGRFGLGLKTASFSQCRRLTVASRKDGTTNCLRWDLDILMSAEDDGWYLFEGPAKGSEEQILPLQAEESGTLVLWENVDRIVTPGFQQQDLLDLIDVVARHISMVFHRYLDGPQSKLKISINGVALNPWDPFLITNSATWSSPIAHLRAEGGTVEVRCHVLPHKDRLDARTYEAAAGPNGFTAQQGFYVYRNERLLVAGSWLGLGQGRSWTKEEAHRLARIRLDIPNTADAAWKIDIRKSIARPPVSVRDGLTRLAEDARERARRVFAHRGQPVRTGDGQTLAQAWRVDHFKGGIRYRVDRDHPAVRSVIDEAGGLGAQIQAMLRVIEETIPVQRIWLDTTEARETPRINFAGEKNSEVQGVLSVLYRNMVVRKGFSAANARAQLARTEPFNNYLDLVAALPDDPSNQN